MTLSEKIAMIHAQSKFSTPGCPRLGIPEIWMSDGPHGVRMEFTWDDWEYANWTNDSCTAMPALTCLAATFNPELARRYGTAVGAEARFRKKDIILGPGVNICRTPLGGRNFEYFGEDPMLTSALCVPYIQGVQSNGVAACLKHFALNNQEKDREAINVNVSERALNEIYLPAFKAGVTKGKVWAVMGSYNRYKGQFCSHNDTLVNTVLKGQWGFDGVLITDWGSAHDTREAAMNGLDIEMGSWTNGLTYGLSSAYDDYFMAEPLKRLVAEGKIPERVIDAKVERIMRLNYRTNMNRQRPFGAMSTSAHLSTSADVAREGIVLLKNEGGLLPCPPRPGMRIAVIGENAIRKLTRGGGSSELKPRVEISPLEGIRRRYSDATVEFSLGYASGEPDYSRELPSPYDADSLLRAACGVAANADIVFYFGGLNKNYTQDCEGADRTSFSLPFGQDRLINALADVNPNIAVVLISGNAVRMPWEARVPALVQSWYLGSMGGVATAEILAGDVNPSGKLPFTIGRELTDWGCHRAQSSYPGVNNEVFYDDDVYVGYRGFERDGIKPLFSFGHGLSYTSFDYQKLDSDKETYTPNDTITVTVTLRNTGNRSGKETVQIYSGQRTPTVDRPVKELRGFDKIELMPGDAGRCKISIPASNLAYYDETIHKWKLESGTYDLYAGASAEDIRHKIQITIR